MYGVELSGRQETILLAIIKTYLETGEPVGSRTISKYTDLNLSSATIRNEMADLEEMGYIMQPHTSAGRIPSDKGYRFYVDHLMADKEREVDEMKEILIEKAKESVQSFKDRIEQMDSQFPFIYRTQLQDENWIKEQQVEIKERIAEAKKELEQRSNYLMMLKLWKQDSLN